MAISHTHVHVLSTTVEILAENPNRSYALIINDSDDTVYIAFGIPAVLSTGIRLNANGGSYEMSRATNNLVSMAVNGISSADHVVCGIEVS
jgi:hypothetical protein